MENRQDSNSSRGHRRRAARSGKGKDLDLSRALMGLVGLSNRGAEKNGLLDSRERQRWEH